MWGPGDVGFFDRVADWYDRLHPVPNADAFRRDFERTDRSVRTVLDLAGGTGRVARALPGRTVVLDRSRGMLRRVPREGASDAAAAADATRPSETTPETTATDGRATPVQGDAGRLPFRPASLDAVVCVDALHHLPAPERALREAADSLQADGVLVLVDFDPATAIGRLVELGERAIGMGSGFHRRRAAIELVEAAGLAVLAVESGWATYRIVAVRSREGPEDKQTER